MKAMIEWIKREPYTALTIALVAVLVKSLLFGGEDARPSLDPPVQPSPPSAPQVAATPAKPTEPTPEPETEPETEPEPQPEPHVVNWETLARADPIIKSPLVYPDGKEYCGRVYIERIEPAGPSQTIIIGRLSYQVSPKMQSYTGLALSDDISLGTLRYNAPAYFAGYYVDNRPYDTVIGQQRIMPVFVATAISAEETPCGPPPVIQPLDSLPPPAPNAAQKECPPSGKKKSQMTGEEYARMRECETAEYLRKRHGQ